MIFSNFIIKWFLREVTREGQHSERELDRIRYVLEVLLQESEKFIYIVGIFVMFGIFVDFNIFTSFLACLVALTTIRPTAGGFHSSTAWGCFCWTLLILVLAIFVLPIIPISNIVILIVGVLSVSTTFIASPFRSEQMERRADKSKDKQKKFVATIVALIWVGVLFIYQEHFLAPSVLWIIFLQNFLLLIEWLRRRKKNA